MECAVLSHSEEDDDVGGCILETSSASAVKEGETGPASP